ncbi:hypothetical protein [Photobacterium damselae]|uniref:hypothetical protein n=1 Tax=Photobacterium damselae TaxID=38293 RepID=UPI003B670371
MINKRFIYLKKRFNELLTSKRVDYLNLTEKELPIAPGVYLISAKIGNKHVPYYVGRTTILSQRLYTNHLMGNLTTARLKKYLVESGEIENSTSAKEFIRNNCSIQWILEDDYRERGALEGFFTAILFPKYGIAPE